MPGVANHWRSSEPWCPGSYWALSYRHTAPQRPRLQPPKTKSGSLPNSIVSRHPLINLYCTAQGLRAHPSGAGQGSVLKRTGLGMQRVLATWACLVNTFLTDDLQSFTAGTPRETSQMAQLLWRLLDAGPGPSGYPRGDVTLLSSHTAESWKVDTSSEQRRPDRHHGITRGLWTMVSDQT